MIEAKLIEIRDALTFIPAMCFKVMGTEEADRYLIASAGYGKEDIEQYQRYTFLIRLNDLECKYDPNHWGDRTMFNAHKYVEDYYELIDSGDVIDVEYILQEKSTVKASQRYEEY